MQLSLLLSLLLLLYLDIHLSLRNQMIHHLKIVIHLKQKQVKSLKKKTTETDKKKQQNLIQRKR